MTSTLATLSDRLLEIGQDCGQHVLTAVSFADHGGPFSIRERPAEMILDTSALSPFCAWKRGGRSSPNHRARCAAPYFGRELRRSRAVIDGSKDPVASRRF